MWIVNNQTPFAADHTWVIDKAGNKIWLVVVKATFDIEPNGRCRLCAEQEPALPMAEAYGEFGKSSLRYEADLLGVKPGTDILVRGDAIAPKGKRVTALDVVLRAGPIQKRLRVTGNRIWTKSVLGGIVMSSPEPFEQMPVIYERAYGGWDRSAPDVEQHRLDGRNPVGIGFAVRLENVDGLQVPNIEYPEQLIAAWTDRPPVAGLNVVDSAWSPRRELAGTYDDNWRRTRFPSWAADFDPHYYNSAPPDQQLQGYLIGGERVDVVNMSENGALSFEIPTVRLSFRTRFGRERLDHDGQLCTVIVEPNVPRAILAWQTSIICNRRDDELDETRVVEKLGTAVSPVL
jgi:hypothetical protein